jgi:hypothetical protein
MKFKKIAKISIAFRLLALLRFGSTGNGISLNVTSALVSSLILFCVKAQKCLLCWHGVYLCVNLHFLQDIQGNQVNLPSFARAYQKDLEPDGMCLDAMLRHIVLQFARVIGTFGAFSGRLV